MTSGFLERLQQGTVICDGAMGTQLHMIGGHAFDQSLEALNLNHPDLIRQIHLGYLGVGAEIIQTNTFGANNLRLSSFGLEDRSDEINHAGVLIAKEARRLNGQEIWIAGSMGPSGHVGLGFNVLDNAMFHNVFAQQAAALADAGVDLLILETFPSIQEMKLAVQGAQSVSDLPIVAQMTFTDEAMTPAGETPEEVVAALELMGVAALGGNCSVGPELFLQVMERMAAIAQLPLVAQPNAGFPLYQEGKLSYSAGPEYMADRSRRMAEVGATIFGGCCGTTPEHIAAIRNAVLKLKPSRKSFPKVSAPRVKENSNEVPAPDSTGLAEKIRNGKFVITVEVDPPRGFDIGPSLEQLKPIANLLDAVNVADNPRAQGRMSAIATCSLIQGRLGVETIMHVAIRHRNLLALHSDLLGAHALGLRNIFAVMGDIPGSGDYPHATAVRDISPSGMARLINDFNRGVDAGGRPIDRPTSFFVGCAFNFAALDMEQELRVLERKVKAGAQFLLSQPVYNPEIVERVYQRLGGFPLPLLLGVLPLRSVRHAQFLHNEVPGVSLPEDIMDRLNRAKNGVPEEGLAISRELIQSLYSRVAGAYFIPPFGRYQIVAETLSGLQIPGVS